MKTAFLAGAVGAAFALQATAGSITLDPQFLAGIELDEAPHLTLDLVGSLNGAAADIALAFHERLDLGQASPQARMMYLASGGLAAYHFQRATSIVFGHEGAHFHTAGINGRGEHEFATEDGVRISLWEAFGEALKSGHVGGLAFSGSADGHVSTEDELMRANNAGLNWQSDYADRMLRQGFAFGEHNVFSSADYLLNRNYWARYALKDQRKDRAPGRGGDPQDLAEHLEAEHGASDALDSMVMWSVASALLSASNYQAMLAMTDYVKDGSTGLFDGKMTWSISNYGYDDSFSVAPVLQVRGKKEGSTWFGGFETSVIGEDWAELHLGGTRALERMNIEAAVTIGEDAGLIEIGAERHFGENYGARIWAALPVGSGETRRGMRLTPENEPVVSTGLVFRF